MGYIVIYGFITLSFQLRTKLNKTVKNHNFGIKHTLRISRYCSEKILQMLQLCRKTPIGFSG